MTSSIAEMQQNSIKRVVGPTILLGSGKYFDFEAPETTPLTIEDVAYGLAYACRFAGQCYSKRLGRRVFYGVADHCEIMSWQVPPHLAYDALMHELGEPTCGDMTAPLKAIVPQYKAIEKRCERAAQGQFNVAMVDPDTIKLFDLRMLATERRDLMNWGNEEWAYIQGAQAFDFHIEPRSPDAAAEAFLARYRQLAPGAHQ